jgi:AraC family transcriptional regulator
MLQQQAHGGACHVLPAGDDSPLVLAHCQAPAHEFHNPGTAHLGVMVVPHCRATQALFDLGNGWRDHFCPEPLSVHVLPPDTDYRWTVNGASTTVILALPIQEVREVLDELELADPMQRLWSVMDRGFVDPMVYELVMRLWGQVRLTAACPELLRQSYIACILHALAARGSARRVASDRGLSKTQLSAVLELIDQRLADTLTLDELASACRMSRFHFIRQFRLTTGQTPYQYLLRQRIEKARALLAGTALGVAHIGATVGFPDPAHFSRAFARHVGLSPQRYRAALR